MKSMCKTLPSCDSYRSVVHNWSKGFPTGNEKILLAAGNNVRAHGNGSLLIKHTTDSIHTFKRIENQKV